MKIAVASDHAGFELKEVIKKFLNKNKIQFSDFGPYSPDSVDYPDFAALVARAVSQKKADLGILICGTGTGMAITANKFPGVRAASCNTVFLAQMARAHNNANVLTLGARVVTAAGARKIVKVFIETKFEGGRHLKRVEKIHRLEKK